MSHRNDLINWDARELFRSLQNYLSTEASGHASRFWLNQSRVRDLETLGRR